MENTSLSQSHTLPGLMRNVACCLLVFCLVSPRVCAENFALFFDAVESPSLTHSRGGSPQDFEWIAPGTARISIKEKKFGTGSLEIPDEFRILPRLEGALAEALSREVRQMSIVLWVRLPEDGTGERFTIAMREGEEKGRGLWNFMWHSEKLGLAFVVGEPEGNMISMGRKPAVEIPAEEWTHMAMVFDEQNVQFFINGEEVEQRELQQAGLGSSMGKDGQGPRLQFLAGLPSGSYVDDFGYFSDTALSAEDVRAIYQAGLQAFLEKGISHD